MLFGKLLPREGNFFEMFNQHADRIVEAARAFSQLVANYSDPHLRDKYNQDVDNAERAADRVTQDVNRLIHKTFITPIDREQIHSLINTMDDVADLIQDSAETMALYDVHHMTEEITRLTDLSLKCCERLRDAVRLLGKIADPAVAEAALDGARAILMERWGENAALVGELRAWMTDVGVIRAKVADGKENEGAKYRDYFDHAESLAKIPSHRLLALFRARREEILLLDLDPGMEADAMVTVFGILNLTEDSFFDESRRLDPAGAVTAAIEMLRVGSDVVDVGPAASHPDARPVSPADEIRRIAPLLDALSDQMHRVSIDSFQPETQRYALKRGVGYLNDIQGFPDPALYPDIAEADCRLVVMHSAQRDGIATRTGHLRPEDALDEIVRFFEARVSALRRSGVAADRLILDPGMGFFLSPAPETSLHVLSNLQKLKSALGLPLLVSVSRKSFLGATVGLPVKDLGPASLAAELHAIGNGADYVRTHAPGDLRSAITFSETLAKFRSRDARDRGLDHA